jgi:paraquat-inducible protein B
MAKKMNPLMVGIFVIGALIIFVFSIAILFHGNFFKKTSSFVLFFNGSMNGLDIGSAVKFKGVRVGMVKSIDIAYDAETEVVLTPLTIEINAGVFSPSAQLLSRTEQEKFYKQQIMNGLAAKLSMESFVTGKLFVELDYQPLYKMRFYGKNKTNLSQIPTIVSEIEKFISGADGILKKLGEFDFKTISQRLSSILTNFDEQLKETNFRELVRNVSNAGISVQTFFNSNTINTLLINASTAMVNLQVFLGKLSGTVEYLGSDVTATTNNIRQTANKFGVACEHVTELIGPSSDLRENFKLFLLHGTKALQSLRYLLDLLNKIPNVIFSGIDYEKKD